MPNPYVQRPPVTKRELVNRLLSDDFNGDFRTLGEGARVSRVSGNMLEIRFDNIDRTFLISAHIPREEKEDWEAPLPQSTRRKGSRQ